MMERYRALSSKEIIALMGINLKNNDNLNSGFFVQSKSDKNIIEAMEDCVFDFDSIEYYAPLDMISIEMYLRGDDDCNRS